MARGVLTSAHPANLSATLIAVLLTSRLSLPARWLAGISLYRPAAAPSPSASPSAKAPSGAARRRAARDDVALGGAETVGAFPAPPSTIRTSDFYGDWEAVVTAAVALAANAGVDAGRWAATGAGDARATLVAAAVAVVAGLLALARSEAVQIRLVRTKWWPPLAVAAAGGAVAAGVALAAPPALLPRPPLAAVAGAASRALYAATEIEVAPTDGLGALILALPASLAAALLPPAAARAVRGADLALHPPAWGAALLEAGPAAAAVTRAALAAPVAAVLAWCPATARVWTADPRLPPAALALAGAASLAAARTVAAGAAGAALAVWYTRKHGFTPPPPPADRAAVAAAEGQLVRMAAGFVNAVVVKRAVEAGAAGLVVGGCGVVAAVGSGSVAAAAAWLGGWCAAVWGASLWWNCLLFRIGFLRDTRA